MSNMYAAASTNAMRADAARASPGSPAAKSTAHRSVRSMVVGTFRRW